MTDKITLKYPITVGGQTVAELNLRRPKGRDVDAMETRKGSQMGRTLQMIADLASVDLDVVRELDLEDLNQVNKWLEPILDPNGERSRSGSS